MQLEDVFGPGHYTDVTAAELNTLNSLGVPRRDLDDRRHAPAPQ